MIDINNVNNNATTGVGISITEIDPTNVELTFAALQNDLAKSSREKAMDKINGIKEAQAKQKQFSEAIVELRNAMSGLSEDAKISTSSIQNIEKIRDICKTHGIKLGEEIDSNLKSAYDNLKTALDNAKGGNINVAKIPNIGQIRNTLRNSDVDFNTKHYANYKEKSTTDLFGVNNIGWATVSSADCKELMDNIAAKMSKISVSSINSCITSLQGMQETVGSDIQQQMLLIQELMGRVSSYSQGAASAINKSNDTTTAILR